MSRSTLSMPTIAAVPARIRRRLARLHRWWWVATALLAGAAAWGVVDAMTGAAAAQDAWGTPVDVLVVRRDVAAGQPLDTEIRSVPSTVVPDDALLAGEMPPGGSGAELVARHAIGAGEMLVAGDVEVGGVVGRIPDGWRAITVMEHRSSGAAIGERVDVVGDGLLIAVGAHVIEVTPAERLVTLAVESSAAPTVAAADATATITLLRRP